MMMMMIAMMKAMVLLVMIMMMILVVLARQAAKRKAMDSVLAVTSADRAANSVSIATQSHDPAVGSKLALSRAQ